MVGHLLHLDDGLDVDRHAVLFHALDCQGFLLAVGVDALGAFRLRGIPQFLQERGEVPKMAGSRAMNPWQVPPLPFMCVWFEVMPMEAMDDSSSTSMP